MMIVVVRQNCHLRFVIIKQKCWNISETYVQTNVASPWSITFNFRLLIDRFFFQPHVTLNLYVMQPRKLSVVMEIRLHLTEWVSVLKGGIIFSCL
jgi:hypothetical protein